MEKQSFLFTFLLAGVFLLLISGCSTKKEPDIEPWPQRGLFLLLPAPTSGRCHIGYEFEDSMMATIYSVSENDYQEYISACVERGFSIDKSSNSVTFDAFNNDGYSLSLVFASSTEELMVFLKAPIEMGQIDWNVLEEVVQLPIPQSSLGKVEWVHDNSFLVYVCETNHETYEEYAKACKESGFTVDCSESDNYYRADNDQGYHLSVSYEGFNTMSIRIEKNDSANNDLTYSSDTESSEEIQQEESRTSSTEGTVDGTEKSTEEYPTASYAPTAETETSVKNLLDEAINNLTYSLACSKNTSSSIRTTMLFDFEKGIMTRITIENHHHGGYWKTIGIVTRPIIGDQESGWVEYYDDIDVSLPFEMGEENEVKAFDYKHEHYTSYQVCDLESAIDALIKGLNEREPEDALASLLP